MRDCAKVIPNGPIMQTPTAPRPRPISLLNGNAGSGRLQTYRMERRLPIHLQYLVPTQLSVQNPSLWRSLLTSWNSSAGVPCPEVCVDVPFRTTNPCSPPPMTFGVVVDILSHWSAKQRIISRSIVVGIVIHSAQFLPYNLRGFWC